jgi:glycosyltransferase involved in cell wall biosynthesis
MTLPSISAQPLVSVCIPAYNHARVLSDALQSVVEQTYEKLEILVLDRWPMRP